MSTVRPDQQLPETWAITVACFLTLQASAWFTAPITTPVGETPGTRVFSMAASLLRSSCARLPACSAPSRSRAAVRCRGAGDTERPVLQLHARQALTFDDVRDAYEVCSLIPAPEERSQCYSVFGLDGVRMAQYYDAVLQLEAGLQTSSRKEKVYDPDDTFWAPQASMSE